MWVNFPDDRLLRHKVGPQVGLWKNYRTAISARPVMRA